MIENHLSRSEIDNYAKRTMPPLELLRADDHLTGCLDCREAIGILPTISRNELLGVFDRAGSDDHLSYEVISGLVEDRLDAVTSEIAAHHLTECNACSIQVNDLVVLRTELLAEPAVEADKKGYWDTLLVGIRSVVGPIIVVPVAALLIVALMLTVWLISGERPPATEMASVIPPANDEVNASAATVNDITEAKAPPVNADPQPELLLTLKDGGDHIGIDKEGKVHGVKDPRFTQLIAKALTGSGPNIAPEPNGLRQRRGSLMGRSKPGIPFGLIAPIGKVVETAQPRLSWVPLQGAEAYRVDIVDEGFHSVASSPELSGTEWQVNVPLKRGRVYRWQVTAITDGKEVKSPVRPAPDARFKVLGANELNKVNSARAQYSKSHLLLGIIYTEVGLLDEAEREFSILVKNNPGSPAARKLLNKVRSAR